MDASDRDAKLLQEMRYIAGISTGQVKRVADAALANMVAPTPSALTDELALAASGEIMSVMYGAMPPGGSVQLQAMVQCIVQRAIEAQQVAVPAPLSDFEVPPAFGEIQYQRPSG
jgi:hypothetical protein